MSLTRDQAVSRAKADLAARLNQPENQIKTQSVEAAEFSDMSLGAPTRNEMSAQMITSGHRIRLSVANKTYEYRADAEQLRLYNFNGANYVV